MHTSIPAPTFSKTTTRLVLGGTGLFALAIIALRVYVGSDVDPLMGEWFVGPDSYMRMVRVWDWLQAMSSGGSWYDTVSARSNWPDGEVLHWTRPLDVALVTLAAPMWPFIGLHKALFYAGVIVSPVMAMVSMWVLMRGTRDLLDLRGQAMLLVLFAFQPITRAYFLAARPDHHALILLAFCMVLALLLRYAFDPDTRRNAPAWAGVAVAFGMWVSVESLTTELFALAALGLAWLITGDVRWLQGLRRFAVAGALALAAMLAVERPPGEWLGSEEYDRLSSVQVVLFALIALGIEFMWRRRVGLGWTNRIAHAALAALGAGILMAALFPDFFKGPFGAAMDPRLDAMWLGKIQELQPLIGADWQSAVGAAQVLSPVIWLAVWAVLRQRERRTGTPFDETMLILVVAGLLYLPLSMFQLRWGAYFGVTVSIAWAALFQRLVDWRGGPLVGPAPGTPILRVPAVIGLVVAHLALSAAISLAAPDDVKDEPKACKWRDLAPVLNSEAFSGGRPLVLLSHIHQGPEILYRTYLSGHRVIGTPYHRNTDGILDAYTALTTTDEAEAHAIMTRRNVDYVVLCVDSAEEKHVLKVEGDTLVRKIVTQSAPRWLEKVSLADGLDDAFRIYRVLLSGP
ncbi:hypothetical protein [Magnetovibrio sp.]|uniref:hypothetical protein n=1 Tax=Magnetovibrio sp. TaxID=2024836 RepID=UPI002F95D572